MGELTKVVKFINTGAAAATSAAASLMEGIQDRVSKFLKGDETSGTSKKPPNLLIYVHEDEKDSAKKFNTFSATLRELLSGDRYTIYRLKKDQVTGAGHIPWASNCRVLFVENDKLNDESVRKAFVDYFLHDAGRLVLFSDPHDGRQALWLLDYAAGGHKWPEVVGEAYERFVRTGERVIPTEMEKFSLAGRDEECAVNLLGGFRGAPPILHFMGGGTSRGAEHGGPEAVFVGSSLESTCMEKGEDVWGEILGAVGLELDKSDHSEHQTTGVPAAGVFFQNEVCRPLSYLLCLLCFPNDSFLCRIWHPKRNHLIRQA